MFLLLRPFLPLILRGLAALALLAAIWWSWAHFVANPYIAKGAAQEHVKTVAALTRTEAASAANKKFSADLAALQGRYRDQAASVAELVAKTVAARAATKKATAALKDSEARHQSEIERLQAIAAGPPAPTKEADCEDTRQLIDDATARRLRL